MGIETKGLFVLLRLTTSIIILTLFCLKLYCQQSFQNTRILDPSNPEYVPGEVLIKFTDNVTVKVKYEANDQIKVSTGVKSIDEFIQARNVINIKKVFRETKESYQRKAGSSQRIIIDYKGKRYEAPKLYNIYKIKIGDGQDVKEISGLLSQYPEIEYAEPNYLVYTSDVLRKSIVPNLLPYLTRIHNSGNRSHRDTYPNDPIYMNGSQGYLDAINAPAAWDTLTGDTNQVIGIIDTGLDWDHPDLDNNIWYNYNEIPENGIDDDGNGYIDDIRGWDFINHDNDPDDDNSHGTHVAGIAGAEGNNEIGITGVLWDVKLLPVKILQSSGGGTSADLAVGIMYASNNGATVINMSLGSYAESHTVKSALENAYAGSGSGDGSILVAAAGNDNWCICSDCGLCFSMYPACYSFVIGVMSADGGFSNFDPSGPVSFTHAEEYNYEISAPGLNIISTLPFGSYGYYTGTSMATPMVSAAVAIMRSYNPQQSIESIFAKLIQGSSNNMLDVYNSLDPVLNPSLIFINWTFADTMPDCNNDGTIDAGETITISLTAKNSGGWADSVNARIALDHAADSAYIRMVDSTSYLGDISSYATATSIDPIMVYIDSLTPHSSKLPFRFTVSANNSTSLNVHDSMNIQNGQELSGILDSTFTLTPDKLWLVNQSFRIESNGVLIILPGTHLLIESYFGIICNGTITGFGTIDSMIYIYGPYGIRINNNYCSDFTYTRFDHSGIAHGCANFQNCVFEGCIPFGTINLENCLIKNTDNINRIGWNGTVKKSNFINCTGSISRNDQASLNHAYNNFSQITNNGAYMGSNNFIGPNNFITSHDQDICAAARGIGTIQLPPLYWGTTDSVLIAERIVDFWDDPLLYFVEYQPILTQPTDSAHGIVWKVEINDIDPQDEYLDPLGSEQVKFTVYFNRPMDTSYTPLLTFSAWKPYTHHTVNDSASWSGDSLSWTAYHTITQETGDGINVIKVSGARDDEGWLIPPEYNGRFKFIIQAASSSAISFTAIAGLDKVMLEWPNATTPDIMGYNMYRYYMLNDTLTSDTTRINSNLIIDSCYTDESVNSGTTYYYLYAIVGTDLIESDYSKIVSATPFATVNGDANGDLSVNVLDITTLVSYLLNQNPDPFVEYAADVNDDQEINILDIIGMVQLINENKSTVGVSLPNINNVLAYYKIEDNMLILESDGNIAGLQFELAISSSQMVEGNLQQLKIFSLRNGFEFAYAPTGDKITGILYSMTQQHIREGRIDLFRFEGLDITNIEVISIFGGNLNGYKVPVYKIDEVEASSATDGFNLKVQPNPVRELAVISWHLAIDAKVIISIYDLKGRKIENIINKNQSSGSYQISWGPNQNPEHKTRNSEITSGIYICHLEAMPMDGSNAISKDIKIVITN